MPFQGSIPGDDHRLANVPSQRLSCRVHRQKTALIGVGLLGGSIGLALKKNNPDGAVCGYVRRNERIEWMEFSGIVDRATADIAEAVTDSDLIVFCTPVASMIDLAEQIKPYIKPGCIVTDVGSVKENLVYELETIISESNAYFIGSHPMAGSEKMGAENARNDLFINALCILTPGRKTPEKVVKQMQLFWEGLGSRTQVMNPELHDEWVGKASHLPHLMAAQLVHFVLGSENSNEIGKICGAGFKDTTRIASGSPEMWKDIVISNRTNLKQSVDEFINKSLELKSLLETGSEKELYQFFEQAKILRDAWCRQRDKEDDDLHPID
jgi:prephenate dehydrogenase